jgi:hypothetical protein
MLIFIKDDFDKLYKPFTNNYCPTLCQRNGACFDILLEKVSEVTNIYLLL